MAPDPHGQRDSRSSPLLVGHGTRFQCHALSASSAFITSSIGSTLMTHGLNVQTISVSPMVVATGFQQSIVWRVDLTFLGTPILISPAFVVSMGNAIAALGGAHANSIWEAHEDLVTVSRVAAPP